ncbi:MAG: hypothetical protein HZA77_15685 [Candidatus Schekmanbacteria bacterium]|nr:hypothetical protein [Candidatus Schekmanbacteria bacterium]
MKMKNINNKGMALLISLLAGMALTLISISAMIIVSTNVFIGKNTKDLTASLYVAEAEAYKALNIVNASTSNYASLSRLTTILSSDSIGTGTGTVTVEKIATDSNGKAVLRLSSTGHSGTSNKSISVIIAPEYNSKFKYAAFAKNKISFSGNFTTVDSYDSSKGAYGGTNVSSDGDIGINSTAAEAMDIGNGDVYGDAYIGPSGNLSTVIHTTSGALLTGIKGVLPSAVDLPPVTIPAFSGSNVSSGTTLSPGNFGDINLEGSNTVVLNAGSSNPGKFYFKSITLSGGGKISITGNVEIYVLRDLVAAGNGIANPSNDTSTLNIYVQKYDENSDGIADNKIELKGNGLFYGGVYAPDVPVKITGNGDMYGALVGESIALDGQGKVHYDTRMATGGGSGGSSITKYIIKSWKDI